jgi:hypothetical protein
MTHERREKKWEMHQCADIAPDRKGEFRARYSDSEPGEFSLISSREGKTNRERREFFRCLNRQYAAAIDEYLSSASDMARGK